jgi:hypothetical protein
MTLLGGCQKFSSWIVKQNDTTIAALKKSIKEDPVKFKSFA